MRGRIDVPMAQRQALTTKEAKAERLAPQLPGTGPRPGTASGTFPSWKAASNSISRAHGR
jgi:hypothetical protein